MHQQFCHLATYVVDDRNKAYPIISAETDDLLGKKTHIKGVRNVSHRWNKLLCRLEDYKLFIFHDDGFSVGWVWESKSVVVLKITDVSDKNESCNLDIGRIYSLWIVSSLRNLGREL